MTIPDSCNNNNGDSVRNQSGLGRLDLTNPFNTIQQLTSNVDKNELSKLNFDVFDCFANDSSTKTKNIDTDADRSIESILKVTN